MARALVVGGTGPTGRHVVQGLQDRGHEVTILHRGTHELPELDGIEHIHTDPHFREAVEQALDSRAVAQGRLGSLSARATALTVAVGGFVGVHVLPALKYPPNPPGVSNADTVVEPSQWYLVMLVISLGVVVGAAVLARALAPRWGSWNAAVVAGLGGLVVVGVAYAVLPVIVANERVPHVLVGPPGAVVLHPHSFGRFAPPRAVAHRVLRLGRRPVPSLVEPAELGDPVALRTRDNLLGVLTREADLVGWFFVVHAVTPVLDLPADRALFSATPVVHRVGGPALRRTLESELPGGLNRTAVAYLASVIDHACPPA